MQSFLAKCAALGIVAGGFTLTGDIGRLAERGQRLLNASTVPSEAAPEPAAGNDVPSSGVESPRAAAPAPAPAAAPAPSASAPAVPPQPAGQATTAAQPAAPATQRATPGVPLLDAPIGRTFAVPAPPTNGPDGIDLRHVPAGSRLLVWVRRPGSPGGARSIDLVALDLIDPKTGEALEHRHAAMTHGSAGTAIHAAPRRVVITRDATGRIAKGGMLRLAGLHGVNGLGSEELIGTIVAVDVPGP